MDDRRKVCRKLEHAIEPYTHAMSLGAEFKWMQDRNTVECLCPEGKVNVLIRRREGCIFTNVKSVDGKCRNGFERGDPV